MGVRASILRGSAAILGSRVGSQAAPGSQAPPGPPIFRDFAQDGSMLEAKTEPKLSKKGCEKRLNFESLLEPQKVEKSSIWEANMDASWASYRIPNRFHFTKRPKAENYYKTNEF